MKPLRWIGKYGKESRKSKFELSGTKDKLNELAAAVAEKSAVMVK